MNVTVVRAPLPTPDALVIELPGGLHIIADPRMSDADLQRVRELAYRKRRGREE